MAKKRYDHWIRFYEENPRYQLSIRKTYPHPDFCKEKVLYFVNLYEWDWRIDHARGVDGRCCKTILEAYWFYWFYRIKYAV